MTKPTVADYINAAKLLYERPNSVIQIVADDDGLDSIEVTEDGLGAYVDARIWIPVESTVPSFTVTVCSVQASWTKHSNLADAQRAAYAKWRACFGWLKVTVFDERAGELLLALEADNALFKRGGSP